MRMRTAVGFVFSLGLGVVVTAFLLIAAVPRIGNAASTAGQAGTSANQKVKLSELRLVIERYVERMSQMDTEHTGAGLSEERKKEIIDETVAKMRTQGVYDSVE